MAILFRNYRIKKQGLACFCSLYIWVFLFYLTIRNRYGDHLRYMKKTVIKKIFEDAGRTCYRDNLDDEEPNIKLNNSIFLISASCEDDLSAHETCVIESVVKSLENHNQHPVYLLFPRDLNNIFVQYKVVDVFRGLQTSNFQLKSFNLYNFVKGTPLEGIFTDHFLNIGERNRRVQEILKFAALYKYGGVVIDLQMLMVKSVEFLGENWAPRVNSTQLGSAVFGLNKNTPIGKTLLEKSMKILMKSQNDTMLDGGLALTKAFEQICENGSFMPGCMDFRQYEPVFFYPINSNENFKYTQSGEIIPSAHGYYVWNASEIFPNRKSLYMKLMSKYCPNIYEIFIE